MLELGGFVGMFVPAQDLELFEPRIGRPRQGFLPLARVAPSIGGRIGFYPLRFLGAEIEGAYMPTRTLEDGYAVTLGAGRIHAVAQLPFWSVAPFVVVGAGALGIRSNPEVILGTDVDATFHLGLGAKAFINRQLAVRLDIRDTISPRTGVNGGATNNLEVLLGVSFTLGRKKDYDAQPEPEPEPPPLAPSDRDSDGFTDAEDECPELPETYNGYEDEDGCPDELPGDTTICSGPPLRSVSFAKGGVALATEQRDRLDETVEVLKRFPDLRVELRGHTDSRGTPSSNRGLATRRAEAVARYLVEAGVEQHRVETLGVGEVEPIATNDTRAGRAKNRRVEFWIIPQ